MKRPRVLTLALAAMLVFAACGDDDTGSTTAETTAETAAETTAATEAPATTTTAAPATTEAPATTAASGGAEATTIDVTLQGDRISVDEIRIKAGQEVTIVVNDIDTETDDPHNFHVRAGDFNIFTNIEEAPNVQEITFTIDEPGEYEFFCDTHLETMFGTLIVEP